MPTMKEHQEKRLHLAAQIQDMAKRQADWTAEDSTAWEGLNKQYDEHMAEMNGQLEREKVSETIQARLAEIESHNRQSLNDERIGLDHGRRQELNPERQLRSFADSKAMAIQAWLRTGEGRSLSGDHREACRKVGIDPAAKEIALSSEFRYGQPAWTVQGRNVDREIRVGLDVANAGAGVETIPEGFMYELERRMLAFGNVRQVCRVISTATGNALPWPTVDDTSNTGALLAEATTIGTSVDPTFAAVTFNAYKYSSKPVFISQELLEDSAFNLGTEIASLLGERLGRIEGSETTTGTGTNRVKGIVTCAGTGVTTSAAAAFTADELIGLAHSLDPAYRGMSSVGYMMHDTALLYARKLKDANGAYIWMPGLSASVPDRLIGFPVSINQNMEPLVNNVPVTAKKHVLFGAFEKYVIRDVAQVRFYRLEERYRDVDQTAFIAFKRMDGDSIQTNALKVLLQA